MNDQYFAAPTVYADDKAKRYPLDTVEHVRAAWSYLTHPATASRYSPRDRERIKLRIQTAAVEMDIDLAVEETLHERMQRQYGGSGNLVYIKKAAKPAPVVDVPVATWVVQEPPQITYATNTANVNSASLVLSALVPEPVAPITKAFLTEANGRTLLTAPASITNGLEAAMTPNEQYQWLGGRLVGAEKPNRNGAFWTTADLELGQATVAHGPVNWLHEARHVIGAIARANLVNTQTAADQPSEPYIEVAAALWKWIYPDEAMVIAQASDMGKLWLSMECISKSVECVGESGCGESVPYGDYVANKACEHMVQRSSIRRFADPTFLGAAILTPPVRPGWAEADARVLRQAASLGEATFEAAGRPDMTTSEWEQLMAAVLRYAEG